MNLTFSCNFRCKYCYQVVSGNADGRLDLEKCLALVDEAADWGIVYFGMTGGEPTLFKGWMTLLEYVLSHDLSPVLTSNGTVIGRDPSIAQRLCEIGLEEITISLDASYPELHHEITNSANSFTKVVNAIRYLLEAGIRVAVKHVLTPLNFDNLEDFIDFVVGLGVAEVGISHMESGAIGSNANRIPNITATQLEVARRIVERKSKTYEGKSVIYPPIDTTCTWDENDWYPCGGLYMGMSIFPSGEVTLCDKICDVENFTFGNVFEQNLREIWEGPAFEAILNRSIDKSRIDGDCARCSKLEVCRTGCFVDSYNAFGDYFAKHPNCGGPFTE